MVLMFVTIVLFGAIIVYGGANKEREEHESWVANCNQVARSFGDDLAGMEELRPDCLELLYPGLAQRRERACIECLFREPTQRRENP